MSASIVKVSNPETYSLTHVKLCKIEIEVDREGKPGFMNLWFARTRKNSSNQWVEDPIPGFNIKIEGALWDALKSTEVEIQSIGSMESILYNLVIQAGLFPYAVDSIETY